MKIFLFIVSLILTNPAFAVINGYCVTAGTPPNLEKNACLAYANNQNLAPFYPPNRPFSYGPLSIYNGGDHRYYLYQSSGGSSVGYWTFNPTTQSCTAPQTNVNGQCTSPACPTGGSYLVDVPQAYQEPSATTKELVIDICAGDSCKYHVTKGNCDYEYSYSDFQGTCQTQTAALTVASGGYPAGSYPTSCTYLTSGTGIEKTTPATGSAILDDNAPKSASPSSNSGKCVVDPKGNVLCDSTVAGAVKCGTVNSQSVCVDTTNGNGSVNGKPYQTSDKNCGFLNGKPTCVSTDSTSTTTQGCLQNGGVRRCVNTDLKSNQTVTSQDNGDGTTTSTTTIHNNVIGDTDTVITTVTNNGTGKTVSTNTKHSSGSGVGQPDNGTGTGDGSGNDQGNGSCKDKIDEVCVGTSTKPEIPEDDGSALNSVMQSGNNIFGYNVQGFVPTMPSNSCTYYVDWTFNVPYLGQKTARIAPCEKLQPLRAVLAWVFSFLTLLSVFFIIFMV